MKMKLCCQNPTSEIIENYKYCLDNLSKSLGELFRQYDKTILTGDLNETIDSKNRETFMNAFNLECLIKNQPVSNMKIRLVQKELIKH